MKIRNILRPRVFALLVAIPSLIFAFMNFFGFKVAPNLTPHLTLGLLAIITTYLATERKTELEEIDKMHTKTIKRIVVSLKGVQTVKLDNPSEYFQHLTNRIRNANKSVDDLTWGIVKTEERMPVENRTYHDYIKSLSYACENENIRVREVFTFPDNQRLERAIGKIQESHPNYHLRYYNVDHNTLPPLLQFTIIDSDEVIIGTHRGKNIPQETEYYLSIKDPGLVNKFCDYYTAIWHEASPVIDLGEDTKSRIEKLREIINVK